MNMEMTTQEHNCKGKIFRYKESRFVRKSGAIVTERSFIPMKKLSCDGCEHCDWYDCSIEDYINENEIESDSYEDGKLYMLIGKSFLCNGYAEPDEWDYELNFVKMNIEESGEIKSGEWVKCNACGHVGYAYGTMIGSSVSAPWCSKCGVNNQLVRVEK